MVHTAGMRICILASLMTLFTVLVFSRTTEAATHEQIRELSTRLVNQVVH